MKKIIKKILPRNLKLFLIERRHMFKVINKKYKKQLKELMIENKGNSLKINDEQIWIDKLVKIAYSDLEYYELGQEFLTCRINILKEIEISKSDIVMICVLKNDLTKIQNYIYHHRKIGVDKFVILDNNSSDGTKEWLLEQDDVFLLNTEDEYTTCRREAWINRIIAFIGMNRWYLVLDSDELLVYNDYENQNIREVIGYFERNKIIRARALMVDMYAKDDYYEGTNVNDYLNECIYFDADTYYDGNNDKFVKIYGGPRKRAFNIDTGLTKYPLFYFRNQDIHCRSLFLYPYKDNFKSKCNLIIKHYKFLPNEMEKYKKIAKDENYYDGSIEYKQIVKKFDETKKISFMYENSQIYKDMKSFNNIDVYKQIDFND